MTIRSVHEEGRATVSTTRSQFGTLSSRIQRYRDGERVNRQFGDIAGLRFPDPLEKQAPSLKAKFLEEVGSEMLDVELRELKIDDQVGITGQLNAEQSLIAQIKNRGGELRSAPFALSDNFQTVHHVFAKGCEIASAVLLLQY